MLDQRLKLPGANERLPTLQRLPIIGFHHFDD
jgi:hypothetical protein